jgi:large subunit ribosomal protein L4
MSDPVTIQAFSSAGEPAGTVAVPEAFTGKMRAHAVWLASVRQMANARTGTHKTKTRGEVSGGGKKPWKQKHTGRARQGSIRAPQWRHGAIIFGPRPRRYGHDLPAKVRRLAMRGAVAEKIRAGLVLAVGDLKGVGKTRDAAALLKKAGVERGALVVLSAADPAVTRAFRNLPGVRIETVAGASVYDMLSYRQVVMVDGALDALAKRCVEGTYS